jgi:hypothetical protein
MLYNVLMNWLLSCQRQSKHRTRGVSDLIVLERAHGQGDHVRVVLNQLDGDVTDVTDRH